MQTLVGEETTHSCHTLFDLVLGNNIIYNIVRILFFLSDLNYTMCTPGEALTQWILSLNFCHGS